MANRLYRSREDRMIAGVCGGIAEYFAIDPVVVRLIFVALLVTGGVGLAAYLVLWIVTPEAGVNKTIADEVRQKVEEKVKGQHNITLALILIVLGVLFLLDTFSLFSFDRLWPLLLVAAGLGILLNGVNKA